MYFSNFHRFLLTTFTMTLWMLCVGFAASGQEIPAGVRYKKASDEVNQKAKAMLESALSTNNGAINVEDLFDGASVCGPLLWEALKDTAGKELRDGKSVILVINGPKPVTKDGRAILTSEQKKSLWKLFIEKIKMSNPFSVRQAVTNEILYFWATIPFDIDEPLLIVDFGKTKVLVNFTAKNGSPKIFWMDIVGDLSKLK